MKYFFQTALGVLIWAFLMMLMAGIHLAYATCNPDNSLCRPNPLRDYNERRLEEIERDQERLERQLRELEQERIEQDLNR